ncbi:MAG: hypothetical protein ACYSTZ_06370, partial [Planctomycetota bacterium]
HAGAALDSVFYLDGVQEEISALAPTALPLIAAVPEFSVGSRAINDDRHWNGLIKEIRHYDERLSNETLLDMSNGIFPGGGGGGIIRNRRARDAAAWHNMMKLKNEDEEAKRLVKQILS